MKVQLHKICNETAELVDIISAEDKPRENEVIKFYGPKAKPADFKAQKVTRLIFKTASGGHVVIPDTAGNRWLWSRL